MNLSKKINFNWCILRNVCFLKAKNSLYPAYPKPSRGVRKKKLKSSSKEKSEDPLNLIMKLGRERDKAQLQRGLILNDLKKEISKATGSESASAFLPSTKKKKKQQTRKKKNNITC